MQALRAYSKISEIVRRTAKTLGRTLLIAATIKHFICFRVSCSVADRVYKLFESLPVGVSSMRRIVPEPDLIRIKPNAQLANRRLEKGHQSARWLKTENPNWRSERRTNSVESLNRWIVKSSNRRFAFQVAWSECCEPVAECNWIQSQTWCRSWTEIPNEIQN